MIIVVSSSSREEQALATLAGKRAHTVYSCASIDQFKAQLRKIPPTVVLARACLVDGYTDDIIALLRAAGFLPGTKIIVLVEADCAAQHEARQLALGADCVLRDPVRPEVLLEYIAKFLQPARESPPPTHLPTDQFSLAGATFLASQQTLTRDNQSVHVTPMEIELARLLAESPGKARSYQFLYGVLFNRSFSGDSANLRVLLGKLAASYRKVGLDLRSKIQVMPKSGYCYLPDGMNQAANSKT